MVVLRVSIGLAVQLVILRGGGGGGLEWEAEEVEWTGQETGEGRRVNVIMIHRFLFTTKLASRRPIPQWVARLSRREMAHGFRHAIIPGRWLQ